MEVTEESIGKLGQNFKEVTAPGDTATTAAVTKVAAVIGVTAVAVVGWERRPSAA